MYSFRISWYNEKIEVRIPELSKLMADRRQKLSNKPGRSGKTSEQPPSTVPETENKHEGTFRESE